MAEAIEKEGKIENLIKSKGFQECMVYYDAERVDVIVKTNVYLKNLSDFEAFNEVYKTFFPEIKPAMTVIPVSDLLVKDALLMVDMVACK